MLPADSVVVSAVAQGELYYGVACKGHRSLALSLYTSSCLG